MLLETAYSTGTLVLKPYANIIRSLVYLRDLKKHFLTPSGIEPPTDELCHDNSVQYTYEIYKNILYAIGD